MSKQLLFRFHCSIHTLRGKTDAWTGNNRHSEFSASHNKALRGFTWCKLWWIMHPKLSPSKGRERFLGFSLPDCVSFSYLQSIIMVVTIHPDNSDSSKEFVSLGEVEDWEQVDISYVYPHVDFRRDLGPTHIDRSLRQSFRQTTTSSSKTESCRHDRAFSRNTGNISLHFGQTFVPTFVNMFSPVSRTSLVCRHGLPFHGQLIVHWSNTSFQSSKTRKTTFQTRNACVWLQMVWNRIHGTGQEKKVPCFWLLGTAVHGCSCCRSWSVCARVCVPSVGLGDRLRPFRNCACLGHFKFNSSHSTPSVKFGDSGQDECLDSIKATVRMQMICTESCAVARIIGIKLWSSLALCFLFPKLGRYFDSQLSGLQWRCREAQGFVSSSSSGAFVRVCSQGHCLVRRIQW